MHLIQGVNTATTRKRKPKMTKGNLQRWAQEMQQYNKRARQMGDQQLTLDEYIDYVHGKGLPKKPRKFEEYKGNTNVNYRSTSHIPSADMTKATGCAVAQEPKQYTGERKLLGIATMHKSNMVPVFEEDDGSKQYAKDLARMRRN